MMAMPERQATIDSDRCVNGESGILARRPRNMNAGRLGHPAAAAGAAIALLTGVDRRQAPRGSAEPDPLDKPRRRNWMKTAVPACGLARLGTGRDSVQR